MTKKTLFLLLSAMLVVLPLASCNDDDDEDEGGAPTTVSFTASNASPPANSISLQAATASGANFSVNVNVTSMTDLYGVAYTLSWSPAILELVDAPKGDFFAPGDNLTTALENGAQGRLVVGHTRIGSVPGKTGSGTMHSLVFRAIASGTTGLQIENMRAADSTGAVIAGVQTFGGTATAHE